MAAGSGTIKAENRLPTGARPEVRRVPVRHIRRVSATPRPGKRWRTI